jgi:nucleoid DNA-binding protein
VENISKHIEKLLAQHDYVVVPDLGGFVVQHESAQILPDMIIPPLSTIAFNPLMLHADGLLTIEVSRSEQISYRNAADFIRKEVEKIKSELQSKKKIELGNLGHLYMASENTLLFAPSERVEFLPGNFQMTDLYIHSRHHTADTASTTGKSLRIEVPTSRIYKYGAVAMVALGLFFSSPKVNDTKLNNSASLAPTLFKVQNMQAPVARPVKDSSTVKPVSDSSNLQAEKTIDKTVAQPMYSAKQKSAAKYYVVVASLTTEEAAHQVCDDLKKEFPSTCVVASHKVYRSAVKSFSEQAEALKYMQKLRNTDYRFAEAWVVSK